MPEQPSRPPARPFRYAAGLRAADLTRAELAQLAQFDVYRVVWSPDFGRGTVVGWFGTPPMIGPLVRFDAERDDDGVRPAHPAGLCYLS